MPRYIDADALIISLAKDRSALVNNHVPHGELHRIDETIWSVIEAPTIDAVPVVRGEWKESKSLDECFWVCSNCKFPSEAHAAPKLYRFCPNCGAKLEDKP